jgi:murein L,D-transpeptidase YafK
MRYVVLIFLPMLLQQQSFKDTQLKNARVKTAYQEKGAVVKKYFADKGLSFAGFQLFIRAFKADGKLEAWVKEKGSDTFTLLHTFDFCAVSGELGPKRKEGDLQIPEGIYHVNHFNPQSNFYLSLGVSYPNASDKILGHQRPGGAIYIHGNCVTIGCIPITDDKIKELYVLAVEARNAGQKEIPIHLFPTPLTTQNLDQLKRQFPSAPLTIHFWENLQPVWQDFEKTKKLKPVRIDKKGDYQLG